jgi:TfoX/Sxy family transcriptional regulator of competence genes
MAEPYLQDLRGLLDRLVPIAGMTRDLTCRHFFAGAAAYAEGRIFMTLTPVGLAVKLPPARCEDLLAAGGNPLRYFPGAPVKKSYVLLPEEAASDDRALARLIAESVQFSLSGIGRS